MSPVSSIVQIVFWSSIILIFYSYFGYPLCLFCLSLIRNRPVQRANIFPSVTFIITAYNEEKRIGQKIENALAQNYPKEKLEIIVVSDCSMDRTDEIVRSFQGQGVGLIRAGERGGKEAAQKIGFDRSIGDVLVFSDVATILDPDGIANIVRNFSDPTVGCVSSVDRFIDRDGKVSGEGAYVRYEMFLRDLETRVNTLVGLSGSFFAARREVCREWAVDLQSDFSTLLNSVKIGLRGISDPSSIGYYHNILDEKKEFERKVRTVLRGISVFMRSLPLLNPFKYGLFSWQLFSHKLSRWLVPFFLILTFFSNIALMPSSMLFVFIFIFQSVFYSAAAFYYGKQSSKERHDLLAVFYQLSKVPYYFVMVNASILLACWSYIKGERAIFWEPSKR
jgi:glycosyltransferase involved in cell wall biosynthesis